MVLTAMALAPLPVHQAHLIRDALYRERAFRRIVEGSSLHSVCRHGAYLGVGPRLWEVGVDGQGRRSPARARLSLRARPDHRRRTLVAPQARRPPDDGSPARQARARPIPSASAPAHRSGTHVTRRQTGRRAAARALAAI
ncbi:hypothetical protein AOLI_G00327140 [Acnodon oligacanthus]